MPNLVNRLFRNTLMVNAKSVTALPVSANTARPLQ